MSTLSTGRVLEVLELMDAHNFVTAIDQPIEDAPTYDELELRRPVTPFPQEEKFYLYGDSSSNDYKLEDILGTLVGLKKHLNRCWKKDVDTNIVDIRQIPNTDTVVFFLEEE